jgi:hypothetical protein
MIKSEDERFIFEQSELDEMRRNMTPYDFEKKYGLTWTTMSYECIKWDYYKHCRALRQIFKNR